MQRDAAKLLVDIRDYAGDAVSIAAGRSLEDFLQNMVFRYAIEQYFMVIGEAVPNLNKIDPGLVAKISDWRDIVGFRNVLVHAYSVISHEKTWDILQAELPLAVERS